MGSGYGTGGYGLGGYGVGVLEQQAAVELAIQAPKQQRPQIDYYTTLLTSEYQQSTNLVAWLNAALQPLLDAANGAWNLSAAFDLDVAVGPQLDIIGQRIGVSRLVGFQPSAGVSPILDDNTFRTLLKAKIARNQWSGQIDALQPLWKNIFPGGTINIVDEQNMTATVILAGVFTSIIQDLILNGYIVPRPEGVLYNYVFSALPILGFDLNNTYIAGFDTGKFA